jgi:hypothetical protein
MGIIDPKPTRWTHGRISFPIAELGAKRLWQVTRTWANGQTEVPLDDDSLGQRVDASRELQAFTTITGGHQRPRAGCPIPAFNKVDFLASMARAGDGSMVNRSVGFEYKAPNLSYVLQMHVTPPRHALRPLSFSPPN